jgi:hypothetical protein
VPSRSSTLLIGFAVVATGAALVATARPAARREQPDGTGGLPSLPPTLHETGLYAGLTGHAIRPGNEPFVPQYPLWSDGATKRRWIHLPPGTSIDASDPDAWQFPVGTRIWKEFSFGRRIETRYMELGPGGWAFATYVWNDAETAAVLAPARGTTTTAEVAPGVTHTIPGGGDCLACHGNATTPVLGFSALQLSPDRDRLAPHREPTPPGAIDLADLLARDRLHGLPPELPLLPPRIAARSPIERAALGYLHGNCGGCHRDDGPLASLGMSLAHRAGDPAARRTTIDRPSRFPLPGAPDAPAVRIASGRPAQSVLLARLRSRAAATQMPPIGTAVVDDDAVQLITTWIEDLD